MQTRTRGQIFRQKAMNKAFTPEELDQVMRVTKPTGWLALLVIGIIMVGVLIWGLLGSLSIKVTTTGVMLDKTGSGQQAILFLPFANKESVQPGMKVLITPAGFSPQEHGYLLGSINNVGQYPLTSRELADVLNNDSLVAIFSQTWPEVMVVVELQMDVSTGSYYWTTSSTSPVNSGTLLQANIIIDEKRPVELLLPN